MIEPQSIVDGRKVLYLRGVDASIPRNRDWKTIVIVLVMAGLFFYLGVSVGITIGRRVQTQGEVRQ